MFFNFSTGDAVEIVRQNKNSEKEMRFRTIVESKESDDTLLLYTPIYKGSVLPMIEGEIFELVYVELDAKASKYNVYAVKAQVLEIVLRNDIHMILVNRISDVKRVQRRDFYRLNLIKPLLIEAVDTDNTIEVLLKDISAGGLKALSPINLELDSEYIIYINLIPDEPYIVRGKVLESTYRDEIYGKSKYLIRLSYINIDKVVQGSIVRQINILQTMEIKKKRNFVSSHVNTNLDSIDHKLLNQYNVDRKFDKKQNGLFLLILMLSFGITAVYLLAGPKEDWAPLFGVVPSQEWKRGMLRINIWLSTIALLLSMFGLLVDKNHYMGRKRTNVLFLVTSSYALISILLLVTMFSIIL